jgi:AAA domain
MTPARLTLTDLVITDGELPPAEVRFAPGLNLIVGASDTGKTFVFEAIDFMLGSKDPLRRIPESVGYSRVSLAIEQPGGPPVTLRRGFDGGEVEATEFGDGRDKPATAVKTLSTTHSADADGSVSAYLLRAIGLGGRQIRKNERGEKQALSFRNICQLTLVNEEEIIRQGSPVLTGQYVTKTAERNLFAFFLSGQDDSDIIAQENQEQRKARLEIEASTIESILLEKRAELAGISADPSGLSDQEGRLEAAIEDAARTVASTQAEITELEKNRAELFDEQTMVKSRLLFLEEQLKRLRLLDEYYQTDRARLTTVIEASRVFHELPEGTCPLCKQSYAPDGLISPTHGEFESACQKEVEKIDALRGDLGSAIGDSGAEESTLRPRLTSVNQQLQDLDVQIQRTLLPASRTVQAELQELVRTRMSVAQGTTLLANVRGLEERLERIRQSQREKPQKTTFANRATTSAATELCQVIEEVLRAWKYPDLGAVTFDTEKADLVIGGQDRANKGKGYRAITYAAFAVGLMKYCRQKGIAHPGFVVLDTPVNPFKGPTATSPDEKLTDEVKVAFFEYLANETGGDQIIVMENEEPPASVRDKVTYYQFTKRRDYGRYGFFPVSDVQPAVNETSAGGAVGGGAKGST